MALWQKPPDSFFDEIVHQREIYEDFWTDWRLVGELRLRNPRFDPEFSCQEVRTFAFKPSWKPIRKPRGRRMLVGSHKTLPR